MTTLRAITLAALASTLLANRIHKKYEDKKADIEKDRDEFDEDLLWRGKDLDDEDDDYEDEDYDDWHPDELDPEVRKERFSKLIKKMDENNDGLIDKIELVHWTLRALQNMDARDLGEDFDIADDNGDGKVSWEEYVENIYGISQDKIPDYTKEDMDDDEELRDFNRMYNREYAKFVAADFNEDTLLNKEEYNLFYNPGKEPKSTEFAIKQALEHVDTNKDGKVDQEEFLADEHVKGHELNEDEMDNLSDIFQQLDIDENGVLENFELTLWLQQDNGEIAADETDHLFSQADEDEDGKLTYDEVHEAMEDFIESDATEYGYMLKHDEL